MPHLTFQDAILRLLTYWAQQGCLIWQPHNVEVGAGTLNPATFLRVLGPEPWNVVYVEPSIRPDDGRYGQNPNRMARHHQLQVILKPDPGDPQQLFLESLASLGIDLKRHDLRFVEDNWESPALGAWGLGWEVWLDGLEITQFTYFQQAGQLDLDPVAIEITYGLDRILMALQDVRHFKDLWWNERVQGVHVQLPAEEETSRYFFETASIERLRTLYDLCEAEAEQALADDLPIVAHDYVLKCSHIFNILDARAAVGVTERAAYFGRMRRLSRQVAERYVAKRAGSLHSLLDPARPWLAGKQVGHAMTQAADEQLSDAGRLPDEAADFVLEVGTEELPVADLELALQTLQERIPKLLADERLEYEALEVFATPRRLVVLVHRLAPRQQDRVEEIVGPPRAVAFTLEGAPTAAAEGFARSVGVTVAELRTVERGGQERVAATRRTLGRPAAEVLAETLSSLLADIPFQRAMRWNASGQSFARPVRWLLALHGEALVNVQFAGLRAGRTTRGLRAAGGREEVISRAEDYLRRLASLGIILDPATRRATIAEQASGAAAATGGQLAADADLLTEVTHLVEAPMAVLGAFDSSYLELPEPVLSAVLKKHQRCFPVLDLDRGGLLPAFVAVANGRELDLDLVRHGNEAVVAARLADAAYFWRRDTARRLEEFAPALARRVFHAQLGSMLDKTQRLERLVPLVARRLGLSEEEVQIASRAARLAKCDLATEMVIEFTSLQGVMGREYALRSGEPAAVAEAIYEQYLPRGFEDALPKTSAGTALALADRLDSLTGLFAAGIRPSGTADPFGLRRAGLALVTILAHTKRRFDLSAAVGDAAGGLPLALAEEDRQELLAFLARRLEGYLRDLGQPADVVAAVLAVQSNDPARAAELAATLASETRRSDWLDTLHAYARCLRIVRPVAEALPPVAPDRFVEPAEGELYRALEDLLPHLDVDDLQQVLAALRQLVPLINRYFDHVLVMAEDRELRLNRLALVRRIADLPARLVDLSLVEGF